MWKKINNWNQPNYYNFSLYVSVPAAALGCCDWSNSFERELQVLLAVFKTGSWHQQMIFKQYLYERVRGLPPLDTQLFLLWSKRTTEIIIIVLFFSVDAFKIKLVWTIGYMCKKLLKLLLLRENKAAVVSAISRVCGKTGMSWRQWAKTIHKLK